MKSAVLLLSAAMFGASSAQLPPVPTFPAAWDADEASDLLVSQGAIPMTGASGENLLCCSEADACQVQVQAQAGHKYFDLAHNRSRFGDVVVFYNLQKEVQVDASMACTAYCPLEGETMEPFGLPTASDEKPTYEGTAMIAGKECEHWQWKEKILGVITMEISDFYYYTDAAGNNIPVLEIDEISPFGQHLGSENTTWTSFKAQAQDPALFAVTGIASCPMSQNCGDSKLQRIRLRNSLFLTYAKHA